MEPRLSVSLSQRERCLQEMGAYETHLNFCAINNPCTKMLTIELCCVPVKSTFGHWQAVIVGHPLSSLTNISAIPLNYFSRCLPLYTLAWARRGKEFSMAHCERLFTPKASANKAPRRSRNFQRKLIEKFRAFF
jgi:hypothetical protein